MSKARNTGNLNNSIQISSTGNITFVNGDTTLMEISSSGAIITTGVISGSDAANAISASYALTSSFASIATSASFASNAATATSASQAQSSNTAITSSFAANANLLDSKDSAEFATTGSNNFVGIQYVANELNPNGFGASASMYTDGGLRVTKDAYVSGTIYVNNLSVFGTQSINYITSSQLNISTNIISVNTDTPFVRFGGLSVYDSGSTGLTGSILWDSERDHWIYSNPSGSTYNSGMLISGPRNSGSLGTEQGTINNVIIKGQGGDHVTSSQMIDDGTTVRIPGNFQVTGSVTVGGTGLFTGTLTAASAATTGRIEFGTNSLKGIMDYSAGTGLWYLHNQSAGAASVDYFQFQADGTTVLNIKKSGASTFLNTLQINQSGSEIQQVINSNSNSNPSVTQYKVNNSSGWEVGMANLANSYSYIFSYGSFGTGNAKFTLTSAGAGTFASSIVSLGGGIEAREGFIDTYHANSDAGAGYYVRSFTNTTGGAKNTIGAFGVLQSNTNQRQGTFFVDLSNGSTPARALTILNTGASTFASTVSVGGTLTVRRPSNGATLIQMQGVDAYGDTSTLGLCDSRSYIRSTVLAGTANGDTDIVFGTQNGGVIADKMRITKEGKVIINDTFMDGLFGINTKSSVAYNPNSYNGGNANIRLSNGSAGVGRYTGIAFGGGGSTEGFFGCVQNSSDLADMVWQTFNGSAYGERMRMYSNGVLQIYNLAGGGTRTVTADPSGILAASSDSSLKQEDTTHQIEGLAEILQLQPRAYKWLSDIERRGEEATTEIGFFANEVAPVIPSAAPKNHDGLYGFYDRAVIAALVKAIQEQQTLITELQEKLERNNII